MVNIATARPSGMKQGMQRSASDRHQQHRQRSRSYRFEPRPAYFAALVLMGGFIFPSDFILPLGGAVSMLTLALMILALPTFAFVKRKMVLGGFVVIGSDILVPTVAAWMMTSMFMHDGIRGMIGNGGIAAFQLVMAYFVARIFFGTPAGFSQFLRVLRIAVIVSLLLAMVDAATGVETIGKLAGSIFHRAASESSAASGPITQPRMGLARSRGSFEHPILMGLFFSTALILLTSCTRDLVVRINFVVICVFGMLLALSSAPFLGVGVYVAISLVANSFRPHSWRWTMVWVSVVYGVGLLIIFVDDPIKALINNLTFDPQTGLFRLLIWKWVGINLSHSPFIGNGFADWVRPEDMPGSVDSLWLVQSLRYGYPGSVLLFLSVVASFWALPLRRAQQYPGPALARGGSTVGIVLLVLVILALTVHFWGTAWVWLGMMIGMRAGATESLFLSPVERGDEWIYHPHLSWQALLHFPMMSTKSSRQSRFRPAVMVPARSSETRTAAARHDPAGP